MGKVEPIRQESVDFGRDPSILRDPDGRVITHMELFGRLGGNGGFVFAHGTPGDRKKGNRGK